MANGLAQVNCDFGALGIHFALGPELVVVLVHAIENVLEINGLAIGIIDHFYQVVLLTNVGFRQAEKCLTGAGIKHGLALRLYSNDLG